jgi:hypothetical protein
LTLSVAIAISLGVFAVMHTSLVLLGASTLEFHLVGASSPYSQGFEGNIAAVFGPRLWERFVPMPPKAAAFDLGTHGRLSDALLLYERSAAAAGPSGNGSDDVGDGGGLLARFRRRAMTWLRRQLRPAPAPPDSRLPGHFSSTGGYPSTRAIVAHWLSPPSASPGSVETV